MRNKNLFIYWVFFIIFLGIIFFILLNGSIFSVTGKIVSDEPSSEFRYAKEAIKQKAKDVAKQIEIYLSLNPEMTIKDLQEDKFFQEIAVQKVGETGYTSISDGDTGEQYFTLQEEMIGKKLEDFKDQIPVLWNFFETEIKGQCKDADLFYEWPDSEGILNEKYAYSVCIEISTKDDKMLVLDASTYLEEYLPEISEEDSQTNILAKETIKQKAEDIAKQIEIYIRSNPEKTIKDLQEDSYFQEIAVQKVGETGYTAVTDYDTLTCRFHKNSEIVDMDLSNLAEELPGFWEIMSKTKGGHEAEGFYDWIEENGELKEKYMYISLVNGKTSDGVGLHVAATTYVDEYSQETIKKLSSSEPIENFIVTKYPFLLLGIILFFALIILVLMKFKLLNISNTKSTLIFLVFVIIITMGFSGGTLIIMENLKHQSLDNFAKIGHVTLTSKVNEITSEFDNLEKHLKIMSIEGKNLDMYGEKMNSILKMNYLMTQEVTYAIYRINKTGHIANMYPIDSNYLGFDVSYQEHIIEISQNKEPVVSGVFDSIEGFKGVTLHDPILINQKYDGTVAYLLNLDNFFLGIESLKKKNNIPLFLIDENHQVIYTTETQLNLSNEPYQADIYFGERTIQDIIENPRSYKIVDLEGEKYLVQLEPLKIRGKKWYFISAQNLEGVYDGLNKTSKTIIFTTFIAIVSIIIFSIILNLYQTKALRREVNKKTRELKEFNKKLEKLVAERTKELMIKSKELEKLNLNLEKKVSLRTKELNQKVKDLANTKTAIINMMQDLKETNEHLKDLDKAKSNFLNVVSHELKTPLTAIFAYLDIMEDLKGNLTKDEIKAFEAIKRNSFQLKSLISNILEISRIAAGKFELINTQVDVNQKIRSAVENLTPLAEKKGIKLIAKTDKTPLKAITDEQRLDEILNNLISNSIKFTDKGSVTVKGSVQGNFFRINVIDTGVGIPKDKLKHLGEKFYQVDASISRKYGGTGLGLSITKQLIELQGGEIKIESNEGKGSTFSVFLPMKQKEANKKIQEKELKGGKKT